MPRGLYVAGETQTVVLPNRLVNKAVTETVADRAGAGQNVPRDSRQTVNESITVARQSNNLITSLRSLYSRDGTFSTAVFNFVEVAMSGHSVKAYNTKTSQFDLQGSLLAEQIIASMDTLYDYSLGYGDKDGMNPLLERCILETLLTGTLANELVLNKARLPEKVLVIPFETMEWKNGKGKRFPIQNRSQGDPVQLDLATIFVTELHRQANRAYADSMLAAGVNSTMQYAEFIQEMRRAVRRQGHGRMILTISLETVMAALPEEIKADNEKLQRALDDIKDRIESELGGLNPEDALVMYDTVTTDMLKGEGEKSDYVPLIETMSGQLAMSLKTPPSILGLRLEGSQSLSNTESLIFLKTANSVRRPTEVNMSRILTLAARLFGSDVYVDFKFNPIDLRPELELEAFKTMRQQRILELLSEGFITDEEAGWELGTGVRAPGAPKLSGTAFLRGSKAVDAKDASPNADPQGRALQSSSPKKAGGKSQ
jgi:hypothetical protein